MSEFIRAVEEGGSFGLRFTDELFEKSSRSDEQSKLIITLWREGPLCLTDLRMLTNETEIQTAVIELVAEGGVSVDELGIVRLVGRDKPSMIDSFRDGISTIVSRIRR